MNRETKETIKTMSNQLLALSDAVNSLKDRVSMLEFELKC